jgi:hypothetical protein
MASAEWDCENGNHTGTLEGIAPGSGLRMAVRGVVGDVALWTGFRDNITVVAGQTTPVGTILMTYSDANNLPPYVTSRTPSVEATNVGLKTTIEVTFSEEVVPESVNTGTFIVSAADVPLPGTLSYTPATRKVVFTPSNDLAYATGYGVVLTPGIEDRQGIKLVSTQWNFTTLCQRFAISATIENGGTISPSGTIQICRGFDQTFTITPPSPAGDCSYYVQALHIDNNPNSVTLPLFVASFSYTFSAVAANHTIRAVTGELCIPPIIISPLYNDATDEITTNSFSSVASIPATKCLSSQTAGGSIWYINGGRGITTSDSPPDGQTWESAFITIQEALDAAAEGDEIWVAAGEYALAQSMVIDKRLELYGGFSGGETLRNERDWQARPTIVRMIADENSPMPPCLYLYAESAQSVIDGFVFQPGDGKEAWRSDLQPGESCVFGGAVCAEHTLPAISNCSER